MQTNSSHSSFGSQKPVGSKKTLKKMLLVGAGAVVTASFAGTLTFALLNETTDKILYDTFYNTTKQQQGAYWLTAKNTNKEDKFVASANGHWENSAFDASISLSGTMTDGKVYGAEFVGKDESFYIKLKDLDKIAEAVFKDDRQAALSTYAKLIARLNNKWLVITENDIKEFTGQQTDKKLQQCVENAITSFQADKKQQREIKKLYETNKFITLTQKANEKIDGENAYHFTVAYDEKRFEDFTKSLETTTLYKKVNDCSKTTDNPGGVLGASTDVTKDNQTANRANKPKPSIDVWVDTARRTLRQIVIKYDDTQAKTSSEFTAKFDFKKKSSVAAPKPDITVKELQAEVESLLDTKPGTTLPQPSAINTKARDSERKIDINATANILEAYYANVGNYPSLADINSKTFRDANKIKLEPKVLADPSQPTVEQLASGSATAVGHYRYKATGKNGAACDAAGQKCEAFTLSAMLESGEVFTRSSQ